MKWNCISILLFFALGCSSQNKDKPKDIEVKEVSETKSTSLLEQQMISSGLINVQVKEPGILVELKYSSTCLLYTSPSPRDRTRSRMPSSA